MKVIFLTTSFPLTPDSSSGIFIARLTAKLSELVKMVLITPADNSATSVFQKDNIQIIPCRYTVRRLQLLAHQPGGLPVILKNHPALWFFVPFMFISLAWQCLRQSINADLLHANWTINGCIAGVVGLLTRKPVITTLRGEDVTRAMKSGVYNKLLKICLILNRKIVCVSSDMQMFIAREFPEYAHKLVTIKNGVDDVFLELGEQRKYDTGKKSLIHFITVGSLIPRKGVAQIIRAMAKVKNEIGIQLEIIGDGPELDNLRKLADELNISGMIDFVGSINPESVHNKLSHADVFIIASYSEGRPNVLVEAMATGLPVIASDIPGTQELVRHDETGLLFSVDDIEQLSACMQELAIDYDKRKRLGISARDFLIKDKITWKDSALNYYHVYKEICGEN